MFKHLVQVTETAPYVQHLFASEIVLRGQNSETDLLLPFVPSERFGIVAVFSETTGVTLDNGILFSLRQRHLSGSDK